MEDITGYGIIIGLFFMILYFIFGLKLNTAGHQLGNNSLRQAGNIIIFILLFSVASAICYAVYIDSNRFQPTKKPIKIYRY